MVIWFYGQKELPSLELRLQPGTEWQYFEKELVINNGPEEVSDFTLGFGLYYAKDEANQIWFDDVRLELLSPEGIEKVR